MSLWGVQNPIEACNDPFLCGQKQVLIHTHSIIMLALQSLKGLHTLTENLKNTQ